MLVGRTDGPMARSIDGPNDRPIEGPTDRPIDRSMDARRFERTNDDVNECFTLARACFNSK